MKVKWGVIGAGGIARRRTIPEGITQGDNCELVAAQDVAPGVAAEVARQFGVRAYECERDLIADPDVQAIYIATPAHLHRAQFERAVTAGKHALIEKPLAHNLKDAGAMVALAAKARRKRIFCAEGYMMKFHPLHAHAREIIRSGKLGKPVFARGQLSCWYPPTKGAWRQNPKLGGGGSLIDMGTHALDLLQWMIGSRIKAVTAFTGHVVHKYPAEDSATALCLFANGCQGVVDTFFNIPDEACLRRLEIYGSQGGILADGTIGQGGGTMRVNCLSAAGEYDAAQARPSAGAGYQPVSAGEFNMYRAEVERFSDCILGDKAPAMNSLAEGLEVMKLADAAYRSAKTGRTVKIK